MTDIKYELEDAVEFFTKTLGKKLPDTDWTAAIAKFPNGQVDCHRVMYAGLHVGQLLPLAYRRPENGAHKSIADFLDQTLAHYASNLYHNAKCAVKHTAPPNNDILKPVLNLSVENTKIEIAKSSTLHDEDNRRSIAKRAGYVLAKLHAAAGLEDFATSAPPAAVSFIQGSITGYLRRGF
jgi:hypothetical protein